MNLILALNMILNFASATEPGLSVTPIKNFPKNYGTHRPQDASTCKGKIDKEVAGEFSWIGEKLEVGIDCLAADFDGNGVKDYALLKSGWSTDESANSSSEIVALMFDKSGAKKALLVTARHNIFTLGLYPPTKKLGPFGEPITKNFGIVEWGEGDSTTIWLYKKGKFEAKDFASENH